MPDVPDKPLPIAVLVSGGGTTLTNLLEQIQSGRLHAEVRLTIADRSCAGVEKSQRAGISTIVLSRKSFSSVAAFSEAIFSRCREEGVRLVVLGGFLARIEIPADFEGRVMNIHPALLPAFCGQGMYGHRVHEAVLARACKVSGCTVHFCDNHYDEGPIILQRAVPVLDGDDADSLQRRVFAAECEAYPEAIRLFAEGRLQIHGHSVSITPRDGG
jgi:formyltetrahydrofolate-dependent phosphoribosylglycinamide formyltransferase